MISAMPYASREHKIIPFEPEVTKRLVVTSKICIKNVLMDLLLSKTVSLPTSSLPICFGSTLYFSRREVTAVKLKIQIVN